MTNANQTDNATALANATGAPAVPFADMDDVSLLLAMTGETVAMAKNESEAEKATMGHGKAYGQRRAVLQFVRNVTGESINASDKAAIGFDNLPPKAKAKTQLSVWHSAFALIAERWQAPATATADFICLSDDQRNGILAGTMSFLTVSDNIRKAIRKAKAEADKAAKASETADKAAAIVEAATPASLSEMLLAVASAIASASDAELAEAADAIALLLETVDANCNVVEAPATVEALAA